MVKLVKCSEVSVPACLWSRRHLSEHQRCPFLASRVLARCGDEKLKKVRRAVFYAGG